MADLRIKICGITQPEQAVAIAQLRAPECSDTVSERSPAEAEQAPARRVTALGFICVKKSPRYVEPEAIAQVTTALTEAHASVDRIGVFAQADIETIQTTVETGGLSGVQLHGDETREVCEAVRSRLPQVELIKAVRVRSPEDLEKALSFVPVVDALLLDAYHPQMLGGTGHTLDWEMLGAFEPGCPWLLAGGLNPGNIAEALTQLHPAGVDLSSGVERSPGEKKIEAVQALISAIARLTSSEFR